MPEEVTELERTVTDLEKQREELQRKANLARANRDKLNGEARSWAEKRDELNAKVREFVGQANDHRRRRDELNEQVQRHKKLRDEAQLKANEWGAKADLLRKQRMPQGLGQLAMLRKEIKRLEFDHQTKVLTPGKEKALIEEISKLQKRLKEKEDTIKKDPELREAVENADRLRDQAEKMHQKVAEMAEKAQVEHDSMVKLFANSDDVRKNADDLQAKFVEIKVQADAVHKEYIDSVNRIHEIETQINEMLHKDTEQRKAAETSSSLRKADEIFEKFKRGEKLSTEDLMTLQKAGLL